MIQPSVGIVILAFNGKEDSLACLESLFKINYSNYTVCFVDNNSSDGTADAISTMFPQVKLVKNDTNLGFAEGNNVGVRAFSSHAPDFYLFLNNDTVVDPDFLSYLVQRAEVFPKAGIFGPKIFYFSPPTTLWSAGGKIDYSTGPFFSIGQYQMDSKEFSFEREVDYINGCCLLIRRDLCEQIGGFDRDYFAYVEDVDMNIHAHQLGYSSLYVPLSRVWHKVSATTGGEVNPRKEFLKARNHVLFLRKRLRGREALLFSTTVFKKYLVILLILLKRGQFSLFKAIISGFTQGFLFRL